MTSINLYKDFKKRHQEISDVLASTRSELNKVKSRLSEKDYERALSYLRSLDEMLLGMDRHVEQSLKESTRKALDGINKWAKIELTKVKDILSK